LAEKRKRQTDFDGGVVMGLGTYLLLTGMAYLLVLLLRPEIRRRDRFWLFTGWSFAVSLLCLAIFAALSVSLGVMQIGVYQDFNLPQDYIRLGAAGWGLLLLGLSGILGPVWIVILFGGRQQRMKR
jgi:uncharacterized membrane protein